MDKTQRGLALLHLGLLSLSLACGAESARCPAGSTKQGKTCVMGDPSREGDGGAGANGAGASGAETTPDASLDEPDTGVSEPSRCRLYRDGDADGFGDKAQPTDDCDAGPGWVKDDTDCDDGNPKTYPGAAERCDEQDNDCDGKADEGLGDALYLDADGDGWGSGAPVELCASEDYVARDGDCDDDDPSVQPEAAELCDNKDNDCDGERDEDARISYYVDCDRDGYAANASGSKVFCRGEQPMPSDGACAFTERVPEGDDIDCDDGDEARAPNKDELCDGIDNNCRDGSDEGLRTIYFVDEDGDGFGSNGKATEALCEQPAGAVLLGGDCNDDPGDPRATAIHPNASEACDYIDNNCDGSIDVDNLGQALQVASWTADCDGDGYKHAAAKTMKGCPNLAPPAVSGCNGPAAVWSLSSSLKSGDDCKPEDAKINPGAKEVCDEVDNNCDDRIDEGVKTVFHADCDGDGYPWNGAPTVEACKAPASFTTQCPQTTNGTPRWLTGTLRTLDCAPRDKNAYPGSAFSSATPIYGGVVGGHQYDYNCDGTNSVIPEALFVQPCTAAWECGKSLECTVGRQETCGDAYTSRSFTIVNGDCYQTNTAKSVSCQ